MTITFFQKEIICDDELKDKPSELVFDVAKGIGFDEVEIWGEREETKWHKK